MIQTYSKEELLKMDLSELFDLCYIIKENIQKKELNSSGLTYLDNFYDVISNVKSSNFDLDETDTDNIILSLYLSIIPSSIKNNAKMMIYMPHFSKDLNDAKNYSIWTNDNLNINLTYVFLKMSHGRNLDEVIRANKSYVSIFTSYIKNHMDKYDIYYEVKNNHIGYIKDNPFELNVDFNNNKSQVSKEKYKEFFADLLKSGIQELEKDIKEKFGNHKTGSYVFNVKTQYYDILWEKFVMETNIEEKPGTHIKLLKF